MCRATLCATFFVLIFSECFVQIHCGMFDMMKEAFGKAKDRIHSAIKESVSDVFAAIKDYAYQSFTLQVTAQAKDKVSQAFESVKNAASMAASMAASTVMGK